MPGPNDYHLDPANPDAGLHPGLGKDEPSDEERDKVSARSARAMEQVERMREEVRVGGALLDQKDKALTEREEAAAKKERELEAREKRLANAEKK